MREKYPYKYEFVSTTDLNDNMASYSKGKAYRFVLLNSWDTHILGYSGGGSQMKTSGLDYHFVDLVNKKDYPPSGISSSWPSMVFKSIINKILKDNP